MSRNSTPLQMQAAVCKQRQQLRASMVGDANDSIRSKEKEDEHLALFMEMKKSEKDQNDLLITNPNYLDSSLEIYPSPDSKPDKALIYTMPPPSVAPIRKTGADDFLNSENDKSDYDWLLTPPGTPLFPSLDMESQRTIMSQISSPKARSSSLKSLAKIEALSSRSSNNAAKQSLLSPSSSSSGLRRPSSSGGPGSRPSTPTRNSFPSAIKPTRSSTPTARPSLSSKPAISSARSSIAVSKPSTVSKVPSPSPSPALKQATRVSSSSSSSSAKPIPSPSPSKASTKVTAPARSSTPTRSAPPRSSTPTSRPSIPPPKSVPRSITPTRKPPSTSVAPVKSVPSASKTPSVPSRGVSPSPQPRPWKPAEMPGYTHDPPPNLRTTPPTRPAAGARGRTGPASSRSSSIEPLSNGRIRRQSCSPSRGRAPVQPSGGSVPALNRLYAKANDHISPALVGTKMVERVINMRKLAPPRPDGKLSPNTGGKSSSSPDGGGFGRTISKKSLDMAIRHMDIRRALPGNLRPLMAKVPASSMYSVRTGPTRVRGASVSDSPVATSSNASSEVSNTGVYLDNVEFEEDFGEREGRSPLRGR